MKAETQPESIVGRYEIGEMFGVTRQGVASILDHEDFPPPICRQGKHRAPLFWRADVERFKEDRDSAAREPQPDAA